MGVIPNPKMTFIFPIACILVLIFPIFMIYFPKCEGKGSFPKSQIKTLGIWCDIGYYWSNSRVLRRLNLTTGTGSDDKFCSSANTKQWQSAIEIRPGNTCHETIVLQVRCCLL